MCSCRGDWALPQPGFPIRISTDQSLVDSSPWLIAATHDLHRHLAPRHPPLALCSLNIAHSSALPREKKGKENKHVFQDARARYAVLKGRAEDPCRTRGGGTRKRSGTPNRSLGSTDVDCGPFYRREGKHKFRGRFLKTEQ